MLEPTLNNYRGRPTYPDDPMRPLRSQREVGNWNFSNVVDNFFTGVRQGMLVDDLLMNDPEVNEATDLPVVRVLGLLGGAVGEGVATQSWMLRGLGALAKTSKVPRVQAAAARALEDWIGSKDVARKIIGNAGLGVASEAGLHVLTGQDLSETASAVGIAGIAGGVVGGVTYGLAARRALKWADSAGALKAGGEVDGKLVSQVGEEAPSRFGRLRSVVNEHARYEHALRRFESVHRIEGGYTYADDLRELKDIEMSVRIKAQKRIVTEVADPINRSAAPDENWRELEEIVKSHAALSRLRIEGKAGVDRASLQEMQTQLDARVQAAPAEVRQAHENYRKMVREVGTYARERYALEQSGDLFEQTDDIFYAGMLADMESMIDSGKRFKVQFLRSGSFIERSRMKEGNFIELLERAQVRIGREQVLDEHMELVFKTHGIDASKLTPEEMRQIAKSDKVKLANGETYKAFNRRPGRIYPAYAVSEAASQYLNRFEPNDALKKAVTAQFGGTTETLAIAPADAIYLPEAIADRLTAKMHGYQDIAKRAADGDIHAKVVGKINELTGAWKYNTVWWGMTRFLLGAQTIGDGVSLLRSNPAAFKGGMQSPVVRFLQEIFKQHKTPMWGSQQRMESAIGAIVGGAGYEIAVDDGTWGERAAAALAGAGLGYAHGTYKAAGSIQEIMHATRQAAIKGLPVDFSVHVPEPSPLVAEGLQRTAVKDVATGKAKVVFHGTQVAFERWDRNFIANNNLFGRGFYFTEDPHVAASYTDKVHPRVQLKQEFDALAEELNAAREQLEAVNNFAMSGDEAAMPEIMQQEIRDFQLSMSSSGLDDDEIAEQLAIKLKRLPKQIMADFEERIGILEYGLNEIDAEMLAMGADDLKIAPNVRVARLKIENPFDMDATATPDVIESLIQRFTVPGWEDAVRETVEDAQTQAGGTLTNEQLYRALESLADSLDMTQALRDVGFDGITHMGGARKGGGNMHRVWIAFDEDQIIDGFESQAARSEPVIARFEQRAGANRVSPATLKIESQRTASPGGSAIYNYAQTRGAIGSGQFAQETEHARRMMGEAYFSSRGMARSPNGRAKDTVLTLLSGRIHGNPAQFAKNWSGAVETLMNERENWLRGASFLQQIEDGVDSRLAAKRARESLVDYGKFTDFEDRYVRGFMLPFYAFTRHNTANWMRTMAGKDVGGKPGVALLAAGGMMATDVAAQAWNATFFPEVEESLAPFQRDNWHLIVGNPATGEAYRDRNGRPMVVLPELGYEPVLELLGVARPHHVANLFGADFTAEESQLDRWLFEEELRAAPLSVKDALGGGVQQMLSLLTPAIRAPMEILRNESYLYRAPIIPEELVGTPHQHAFVLDHLAKEAFRQYREADRIVRETGRGTWSPINSNIGAGLPIASVDVDANVRRHLHDMMERAQRTERTELGEWQKQIDDLVYARPQWNVVDPGEHAKLMEIVTKYVDRPEDRERAVRYYMERTSKSSPQRHWNMLRMNERANFMKAASPADLAAFMYYVNGGEKLADASAGS